MRRLAFGSANVAVLAVLFVAVGASTALVETGEGSHAAELLDPAIRGRGFGLLGLVDGVGDLVSSVVVGILFTITSPAWGFGYAAVLAAAGGSCWPQNAPAGQILARWRDPYDLSHRIAHGIGVPGFAGSANSVGSTRPRGRGDRDREGVPSGASTPGAAKRLSFATVTRRAAAAPAYARQSPT